MKKVYNGYQWIQKLKTKMCKQLLRKILFLIELLLITGASCFNLSSIIDKDELWNALLRGEIGYNHTNSFYSIDSNLLSPSKLDLNTDINYDESMPEEIDEDSKTKLINVINDEKPTISAVSSTINNKDNDSQKFKNSLNEKQHVKRDHSIIGDSTIINKTDDHLFETVLIDDFDKFIPQLMNVVDSDVIQIKSFANGTKTIRDLTARLPTTINNGRPKPGQTSLVIVFDGTGSMENCLIQLRSGAKLIIERFTNRSDNPIYNYIFVPFRDPRKFF